MLKFWQVPRRLDDTAAILTVHTGKKGTFMYETPIFVN